jgi:hypothetical protein
MQSGACSSSFEQVLLSDYSFQRDATARSRSEEKKRNPGGGYARFDNALAWM